MFSDNLLHKGGWEVGGCPCEDLPPGRSLLTFSVKGQGVIFLALLGHILSLSHIALFIFKTTLSNVKTIFFKDCTSTGWGPGLVCVFAASSQARDARAMWPGPTLRKTVRLLGGSGAPGAPVKETNEVTPVKTEGAASGLCALSLTHGQEIYNREDIIRAEHDDVLEELINMGKSLGKELSNNYKRFTRECVCTLCSGE